jgi:hypothetical protein
MKEAFVHIGAHKTASTFLQQNLIRQRARLMDECALALVTRADLLPTPFAEEIYAVSQAEHPGSEISEVARNSLRELLPDNDANVLVTNEDLICRLDITDFYQHAEAAVGYLRDALVEYDLHVIFYIRKQADYLESIYMQLIHLGRRLKFAQFMKRATPVDLSWLRAAEAMERALLPGRLHVRTYEQIWSMGQTDFYRDFLSLCGIGNVAEFDIDTEVAKGRPANRSYGNLGLQIAQRVNPILSPKERKLLRRFLQENFSTETHPRAELLDEQQRQTMFEVYQDSNRRLFERFDLGVDGSALGYY